MIVSCAGRERHRRDGDEAIHHTFIGVSRSLGVGWRAIGSSGPGRTSWAIVKLPASRPGTAAIRRRSKRVGKQTERRAGPQGARLTTSLTGPVLDLIAAGQWERATG